MFQVEIWKVSLKNGFKNASPVTWPIYLVQMWNLSQISCIIMSRNHMFRSSATRFSFSFDASSLSSWLALQLLTQRIFLAFMLFHDVVGFQVTVVFWSNCATSACLSHDRRRRPCFDRHVKARPEKNIFRRKFWVRIDKLDKPDGGLVKFLLAEARSKSCRCRGPGCLSSSASSGLGSILRRQDVFWKKSFQPSQISKPIFGVPLRECWHVECERFMVWPLDE